MNVAGRSLLEQLSQVIDAVRLHNRRIELDASWVRGQTNRIPDLAAREALVNGVTHRDWQSSAATEVEHVGDRYTVTCPRRCSGRSLRIRGLPTEFVDQGGWSGC